MNGETLGEFIIAARKKRELSARQLAQLLDISPVYVCDFEKDRRPVPDEILGKMRLVFLLSEEETGRMYDLAAIAKNTVSADLPKYIMANELVRTALRKAQKDKSYDAKLQKFLEETIREE